MPPSSLNVAKTRPRSSRDLRTKREVAVLVNRSNREDPRTAGTDLTEDAVLGDGRIPAV